MTWPCSAGACPSFAVVVEVLVRAWKSMKRLLGFAIPRGAKVSEAENPGSSPELSKIDTVTRALAWMWSQLRSVRSDAMIQGNARAGAELDDRGRGVCCGLGMTCYSCAAIDWKPRRSRAVARAAGRRRAGAKNI